MQPRLAFSVFLLQLSKHAEMIRMSRDIPCLKQISNPSLPVCSHWYTQHDDIEIKIDTDVLYKTAKLYELIFIVPKSMYYHFSS